MRVRDNTANVIVTYLYGRADQAPRSAPPDTLTDTSGVADCRVLGTHVTDDNGLRLYAVVNDGVHVDTFNLSRRVRREVGSDVSTDAGRWVPLRTTVDLDSTSLAPVLRDHLGGTSYDNLRCRVFRWYGSSPDSAYDWMEYSAARDSLFSLEPGRLMWIKSSSTSALDFGSGITTSLRDTLTLQLAPNNWTDFTIPYNFAMRVGDIIDATGGAADSLQIYWWERPNGSAQYATSPLFLPGLSTFEDRTASMQAGALKGYSVYNPLDRAVTLRIPPTCLAMSTVSNTPGKQLQARNAWALRVEARVGEVRQGSPVYCGYDSRTPGVAKTLFAVAPSFGDVGVRLVEDGQYYGHSVYHQSDERGGYAFKLRFFNKSQADQDLSCVLGGLEQLGDSLSVFLVDPRTGQLTPVSDKVSLSVVAGSSVDKVLAVGSAGYARSFLANVMPFAQFAAYPNPFRGILNVRFLMPEKVKQVSCRLFDASGRLVWRHELRDVRVGTVNHVVWDGRSSLEKSVASGSFVLQLRAIGADGEVLEGRRQRLMLLH